MSNNERLRSAMVRSRISIEDIRREVGVDPKTVQRWLNGRRPHQRLRWALAAMLDEDEGYLWPRTADELTTGAGSTAELVSAYAHRANVPTQVWTRLVDDARRQVHVLGYAVLFLIEAYPGLAQRLVAKASDGCEVRVALADPASDEVAARDAEEGLRGGLVARVRTAMKHLAPVAEAQLPELRLHHTPMYNSLFRFDERMLVTPHLFGRSGFEAPTLHLRRLGDGGIFDTFAQHFEDTWAEAVPTEGMTT